MSRIKAKMNRRTLLRATAASTLALAAPSVLRAQDAPLKVGVYGGYFQDSFDAFVYPEFTAATGIEVESIAVPTGEAWLIQMQQAARAPPRAVGRVDDGDHGRSAWDADGRVRKP